MMGRFCNICERKNSIYCNECLKNDETLNFRPLREHSEKFYYSSSWNSPGKNCFSWNTTNESAVETRVVYIGNTAYCPYCGNKALALQRNIKRFNDYEISGYCCLCDGALAESEYESLKAALIAEHEKELEGLKREWLPKLKYDADKLFQIEQTRRTNRFNSNKDYGCSYFSTINGKTPDTIDKLLHID